ncbi:furin-like isoform X2 [Zophobas morio]|uniref:furin-like isoform X2 n=1 Tax=Zophobas morio TaxID=2755281 RepID=UPI0030838F54
MHKSKKKAVEINKLHSHRHDWIVTFKKPLKEQTFLQQAIDFAEEHDLHLFGQVLHLTNTFSYRPRPYCVSFQGSPCYHSFNSTGFFEYAIYKRLKEDNRTIEIQQEKILSRKKRYIDSTFTISDPYYPRQWHLHNHHNDTNVQEAWRQGFFGDGVVVTVIDDGLEYTNIDLIRCYDPLASFDVDDQDYDPFPRYSSDNINKHGTRCAGEIAAAPNSFCGVGLAYNAKCGAIRLLDAAISDYMEAQALSYQNNHTHIYTSSWGPSDDGATVDGMGSLTFQALENAVLTGRNGLGNIFVFASGNGGKQDDCNCDGYVNSIYTLAIGAVSRDNSSPQYAETCSAIIAATYSSGTSGDSYITTSDLHNSCTFTHGGTSAAAPIASAIYALVLQANMNLTWRDILHLTVATAEPKVGRGVFYSLNGIGRNVSHETGFGILNAGLMVSAAKLWETVPPMKTYVSPIVNPPQLVEGSSLNSSIFIPNLPGVEVNFLEYVQVNTTVTCRRRSSIKIKLISPMKTVSILLKRRPKDYYSSNCLNNWTFSSVHYWGERPTGKWTLQVEKVEEDLVSLKSWQLILHGTEFCSSPACRPPEVCYPHITKRPAVSNSTTIPTPKINLLEVVMLGCLGLAAAVFGLVFIVGYVRRRYASKYRSLTYPDLLNINEFDESCI